MLITKEQQEALLDGYIRSGRGRDEVIGFYDGMRAMLDLVGRVAERRDQDLAEIMLDSFREGFAAATEALIGANSKVQKHSEAVSDEYTEQPLDNFQPTSIPEKQIEDLD
jgi:hypothetical protein